MKPQWCYLYLLMLILPAAITNVKAQDISDIALGPNLVVNPGFEDGTKGWNVGPATITSSQAHSGNNSLVYNNTDPNNYKLIIQNFKVVPGQVIHFSAWVKGQDINTSNLYAAKGAGVIIQGYDASGKNIDNAAPFTFTGTFDWRQIEGTYIVPPTGTRILLGLFFRIKSYGTVWFDDVSLRIEGAGLLNTGLKTITKLQSLVGLKPMAATSQDPSASQFDANLQYPNYRNTISPNEKWNWKINVDNNTGSPVIVKTTLLGPNNNQLAVQTNTVNGNDESQITWTPVNVLPGTYKWQLEAYLNNILIQKRNFVIQVNNTMPNNYIDQQGFTVTDGKRFFPLGIYLGKGPKEGDWATTDDNLQRIQDAGFNTILAYTYGSRPAYVNYMNRASAHKLKVIYSFTDMYEGSADNSRIGVSTSALTTQYIEGIKNNPTLLAYYINDEYGTGEMQSISSVYQNIIGTDTEHPVLQINNKPAILSMYTNSSDIIGTDPYIIQGNTTTSLKRESDWTRAAIKAAANKKGVWQVIQMFDKIFQKSNLPSHPPTLDEMRNLSYQALISGAKGLMFYAYHWLFYGPDKKYSEDAFNQRWPDVVKMMQEVNNITPVILKNKIVPVTRVGFAYTQYQAWQDDDKLYIVLANTENQTAANIFTVPDGNWKLKTSVGMASVAYATNNIRVNLAPLGSGVIVLEK